MDMWIDDIMMWTNLDTYEVIKRVVQDRQTWRNYTTSCRSSTSEDGRRLSSYPPTAHWTSTGLPSRTSYHPALIFSSSVIFLLVDACVGLNWLLVSFLSHVNKNIIHSFMMMWTDKCKAQALFSVHGGQKHENYV